MQQAIEEAKKMKENWLMCFKKSQSGGYLTKMEAMDLLIERLEGMPQEPTTGLSVESLLEELGASIHQMRDGSRDWKAYINLDAFEEYHEAYGDTPRFALLALKEKLSTNN